MIKVGIVGGTGYTGVELLRLLASHPEAEVAAITSRGDAGTRVDAMFPSLRGHIDLEFRVSTSDIDSEGVGILWASQKQTFPITVIAPELPKKGERTEATGAEVDGTVGHPGAADANQGSQLDDGAVTPIDALAASVGADAGGPDDDPDSEGGHPDAGAAEQAEVEAGMRDSITAAGLRPRRGAAKVH